MKPIAVFSGPARTLFDPAGRIHAEQVVPGGPQWFRLLADDQVRSSTYQVHDELPSAALVGLSEQDAQDVAVTKLLPQFPERDPTLLGLLYMLHRHRWSQQHQDYLAAHLPRVLKHEGGQTRAQQGRGIEREVPPDNRHVLSPRHGTVTQTSTANSTHATLQAPAVADRPCWRAYGSAASARARNAGGSVSPSALAVVRLTTSSGFAGDSTGSAAGLAPLRSWSTYTAARRAKTCRFGP